MFYAPDIAPDAAKPWAREFFADVLLINRLHTAVRPQLILACLPPR